MHKIIECFVCYSDWSSLANIFVFPSEAFCGILNLRLVFMGMEPALVNANPNRKVRKVSENLNHNPFYGENFYPYDYGVRFSSCARTHTKPHTKPDVQREKKLNRIVFIWCLILTILTWCTLCMKYMQYFR